MLKIIQQNVIKQGCFHLENPSRVGNFVYQMNREEQELRNQQVEFFKRFCGGEFLKLLRIPAVRKLIEIPDQWLDMAHETNPNNIPMTVYFGFDLCGPDWVINDLNADRATIAGFQPEIVGAFKVNGFQNLNFRSFYDGLFPAFELYSGKKNPKVMILKNKNDPYEFMLQQLAKRYGFILCTPEDFSAEGVDIVFRTIRTHDTFFVDQNRYGKVLHELRNGLPMINPLGAAIPGHKGWLTVLMNQGLVDQSWFPKSWYVTKEFTVSSEGNTYDRNWTDQFLKNRNTLVVKNVLSAGGREVFRGKDMKLHAWEEFWKKIFDANQAVLVELIQPKNEREIEVIDGDGTTLKNLNLLQRIYGVQGTDGFFGEVFGSPGWKVNAAGYTFPIAF